jgi:hypothetical protein
MYKWRERNGGGYQDYKDHRSESDANGSLFRNLERYKGRNLVHVMAPYCASTSPTYLPSILPIHCVPVSIAAALQASGRFKRKTVKKAGASFSSGVCTMYRSARLRFEKC